MQRSTNGGFTILEILIVVAIIGIIAAIVLVALGDSREKSRNAAVISQMYEYQKALELSFSEAGSYPGTNAARTQRRCIGAGLDEYTPPYRCMGSLTTAYSPAASADIEAVFLQYINELPRFDQAKDSFNYSSPAYSGCTGEGMNNTSCTINDYSIWYLLEGIDQDCGFADVADNNLSDRYTLCRLMP